MQEFGGEWTETKLECINKYLKAYLQALKRYNFTKFYIDAFAGTGYRVQHQSACDNSLLSVVEESKSPETTQIIDGSALEAIKLDPPFNIYVFIEKSKGKCDELNNAIAKYPSKNSKIMILSDDANIAIRELCSRWQRSWRGVLFLDPFGLQVDWSTIEAIASTQAIDMWYLFPTGIGINRMLPKDKCFPSGFSERLDRVLGTHDWIDRFYSPMISPPSLFDEEKEYDAKVANQEAIEQYVVERLKSLFCGVAEKPLTLYNSKRSPMFSLCFACNNPRGADIALRIASHILKS